MEDDIVEWVIVRLTEHVLGEEGQRLLVLEAQVAVDGKARQPLVPAGQCAKGEHRRVAAALAPDAVVCRFGLGF